MKKNTELASVVNNAIKWERSMHETNIVVALKDGSVTLSGTVDSYYKKNLAVRAAKNVIGVKEVIDLVMINYGNSFKIPDTKIAKDVLSTWRYNWEVPNNQIKVKVANGWVNLEGEVPWKYQEEAAEKAIKNLPGIKGISNLIKVKSESTDILEKKDIENALKRNWSINSVDIKVEVQQNNVKLKGLVHSLYQKEEAGRLAWNAPGVRSVANELAVIDV